MAESARQGSSLRALLEKMRLRHIAYAAMHTMASRSAARFHRNFTVLILTITLVTTIVTSSIQVFLSSKWTTLVSNAALATIGGLTAINNFLGYQKREEKHRASRSGHLQAAGLIEIAIACDEENPLAHYDYASVLEDVQEIHNNLQKDAAEIPGWVAKRYPQYEAPWLMQS